MSASAAHNGDSQIAPPGLRHFWLVADDYGISPAVNAAIRDLLARRRLNATSVMVVTPSFDEAQAQALSAVSQTAPGSAIGLHLTLTAPFRPLSKGFAPLRGDGAFPSLGGLMRAAFLRQIDGAKIAEEAASQMIKFSAAFRRPPDFVDGHQHVHLLPGIRSAVIAAMKRAAPRAWLRQCAGPAPAGSGLSLKARFIAWLSSGLAREAAAAGIATNPAFAGAYSYSPGVDFAALFPSFIVSLPAESVVMCHPGKVDEALRRVDPLTTLREQEYAYFAGDEFPRVLAAHGLTLT